MYNMNMFIVTLFGLAIATAYVQANDCPGCPIVHDPNDPHLRDLVTQVLAKKDAGAHFVKVIKATSQVIDGARYVVEFEIKSGDVVKICDASFTERVWLDPKLTIEDFECRSK